MRKRLLNDSNNGVPVYGISCAHKTMHVHPADGEIESPLFILLFLIASHDWPFGFFSSIRFVSVCCYCFFLSRNRIAKANSWRRITCQKCFNIVFHAGNLCVWNNNCVVSDLIHIFQLKFTLRRFCFHRFASRFFCHSVCRSSVFFRAPFMGGLKQRIHWLAAYHRWCGARSTNK